MTKLYKETRFEDAEPIPLPEEWEVESFKNCIVKKRIKGFL